MGNSDSKTVQGFGDEWSRFDQGALSVAEHHELFEKYFKIFPWAALPQDAEGFDLGCGSGRWAKLAASRVKTLHCIDASAQALDVAKKNLAGLSQPKFHHASVDAIPLEVESMDFGYSLGVLHHVPDTKAGLQACVRMLKPGAPFLLYLYYAFDNQPAWYRATWKASDILRRALSRSPRVIKNLASEVIAAGVYLPLAKAAKTAEKLGIDPSRIPLSFYRNLSFYTMRTDALDRFGTRLEQRFTRPQIQQMMNDAGLERVQFSESAPYWIALGYRRAQLT